jgi:hypothetical protein
MHAEHAVAPLSSPLLFTDSQGRSCSVSELRGRPVLVALGVPDFDGAQADVLRPELRGLGSALLLLNAAPAPSWLVMPDDELEPVAPCSPEALAAFLAQHAAPGCLTLLVLERGEVVWCHRGEGTSLTLVDALRRAAAEHRGPCA